MQMASPWCILRSISKYLNRNEVLSVALAMNRQNILRTKNRQYMTHLPETDHRQIETPYGSVIGASYQWDGGQYCAIHTANGVVGCGIYDIDCANEFKMAFAIAKGTPEHPLRTPEDLYKAKIVGVSDAAIQFGVVVGMTGLEALEKLLAAGS